MSNENEIGSKLRDIVETFLVYRKVNKSVNFDFVTIFGRLVIFGFETSQKTGQISKFFREHHCYLE